MNIGNVSVPAKTALAPMAGATDAAFRRICMENGALYTCLEMVSAKALVMKNRKTEKLLLINKNEHPSAAQLFGHEPEVVAEAAAMLAALCSADVVDINMGCPAPKVVGSGDGAALMKDIKTAERIISATVKAASKPVTVKFRKGWDENSVNAVDFARMAESAGAAAVCIHGRTRSQMYAGLADRRIIALVKRAVKIPVIANGDITSPEDAGRMLDETGADMVMIGRGALGNPWIFGRTEAYLAGEAPAPPPALYERLDTVLRQVGYACAEKGEYAACREARGHMAWYLKGIRGAAAFRHRVSHIESLSGLKELCGEILSVNRAY